MKIARIPCNQCGGLISWDKKIDGRFPAHVDKSGFIIDDGSCPKYRKSSGKISVQSTEQISFFKTEKFNRFNLKPTDPEYILPIFKGKTPLIPRFYIGKIELDFKVYKKIIKIPPNLLIFNIWRLAHGIIRNFLNEKDLFSFFRIIKPSEENNSGFIHLFIVPHQHFDVAETDNLIISSINKLTTGTEFTEDLIINKKISEEIITVQNIFNYVRNIKTFFDALVYSIKYKMNNGEFRTTTHYELVDNNLYFYVDVDAIFYGKGLPATREDLGKFIFGELKDKNKKYLLVEITSCVVVNHLNTLEYQKFLKFSRDMFENRGYTKMKEDNKDWSIKDYWDKINDVNIPENDAIAIVENKSEMKLFFPLSRLFKSEKREVAREIRFKAIQNAKKELFDILEKRKNQLKNYSHTISVISSEQITPRFFDLIKYPIYVEFAEEKLVQIKRDERDCNKLNCIPQELLKDRDDLYKPIAGKFNFLIIPIVPDDLSNRELKNAKGLLEDIANGLKRYKLSDDSEISAFIKYKFDRDDIYNRKHNKWGAIFEKHIKPKLKAINDEISNKDVIAIPLIGLRNMGMSSNLFKYYLQNEFYKLLKVELNKNHFSVIQSFLVDESESYKGSKLAVMLYKNSLFNIAANCPNSNIAKRIQNGILFKFKYPFGTRDVNHPIESVEMQAGFDASKIWGVEDSKPRGAVIVTLDPYGKQVRSKYIRDARTHKGLLSESVIKDLILELLKHQDQLINNGLKRDLELPKKIIFLFDGDINNKQKDLFVKVYRELIESGEYPILPEFIIFEVLKSHPSRMYLLKYDKIYDVPFGVMALLNDKEFLIKSHIWNKRSMAQPQLYRFKMRLSQRYKDIARYSILNVEMVNIAVQLFQSTLFNTGKSGRPLKESFVIHESHKLSQEFASKSNSIGVLYYKD